jgi:DNA repair protein RadC
MAAFEIGRRVEAQGEGERVQVCQPADVAATYGPKLRDLKREVFVIVLLNTANVITGDFTISEGGLAASIVEPRAVFQRAVVENAAAIICLHNHPSGNPEPSREDVQITKQLVEAGKLMGIPVHDHLIIAGRGYTSLAERGLM